MLSSIPIKINPVRDISQHITIEDALKVLKETGLVNCQFDLQELFENQSSVTSAEGTHNLEKALSTLFPFSPAAAIYTGTPISFEDNCDNCRYSPNSRKRWWQQFWYNRFCQLLWRKSTTHWQEVKRMEKGENSPKYLTRGLSKPRSDES